jgi:signal transduction histidine kinase
MTQPSLERVTAEELMQLPLFAGETPEAVEWIASKMDVLRFEAGEQMVSENDPVRNFILILEGEVHYQRTGWDELLVAPAGQVTGVLPFSRIKTWAGRGWAAQASRIAVMDASHLRELVYRAPTVAQRLVSEMTDRTREFTRMEESSNRLLALGRLAAGLAHELNNPASAAVRSSARLRDVLSERRKYALALRGVVLPEEARELMSDIVEAVTGCATTPGALDAIERADRESDLADWLESVGVGVQFASELVDAGVTAEQLRPLASMVSSEILELGLHILVADHEILCLTRELEEASKRISDLVQAVKSYSYMDQSAVGEVDIEQGIDVTLRMFQHQLKQGIEVSRRFAGNLPRVRANGSALNQIWTNLIDNALHALGSLPAGQPKVLLVRTCQEPDCVLVEIGDNGPGIPEHVRHRMFEPFFTTKPVGEGTGLGLDIVQRIIKTHRGSIRVESAPGRTLFQVRLPVGRGEPRPVNAQPA